MKEEAEIEKSLSDQILDKTIQKLKESDVFSDKLIEKIKDVDLTVKTDVKEALSSFEDEEE